MNRTLLLILCDFLLLNLLALTRWEQAKPPATPTPAPATATASSQAATAGKDLVDTMKLSLQDEQASRAQLQQQLQATQTQLQERDQNLSSLQSEQAKLSSTLETTQRRAEELSQRATSAAQDASVSKDRLAQLQREFEEKRKLAEEQASQLTKLEQQQQEARQKIEGLSVAVKVAEQEKLLLRETADTLKTQVDAERTERLKAQETTTQLAQGVGQLAEKSTELTKEIRDNRPVNANTLFNEFLANRVGTSFTAFRQGLLGPVNRAKDARTILVTDGQTTYALLHLDDTPFSLRENPSDWAKLTATFRKGEVRAEARELDFLQVDPRVAVIPLTSEQVAAIGAKVYQTALDPFKFPEAVLISNGGSGYGEVPFKLDPQNVNYVRMDNRLIRRLFGDFSPSRGDLVLSKTGELLGIMVNAEYCAVVNNFLAAQRFPLGDVPASDPTSVKLEDLIRRWRSLPLAKQ